MNNICAVCHKAILGEAKYTPKGFVHRRCFTAIGEQELFKFDSADVEFLSEDNIDIDDIDEHESLGSPTAQLFGAATRKFVVHFTDSGGSDYLFSANDIEDIVDFVGGCIIEGNADVRTKFSARLEDFLVCAVFQDKVKMKVRPTFHLEIVGPEAEIEIDGEAQLRGTGGGNNDAD